MTVKTEGEDHVPCTPDRRSQAGRAGTALAMVRAALARHRRARARRADAAPRRVAGWRAVRGGDLVRLRSRDRRAARRRRIHRAPEPGPVRQPRRHPAHPGAAAEVHRAGDLLRAGGLGHAPRRRAAPRRGRRPRDRHPRLDPRAQFDPARGLGARPADARGRHAGEDFRPASGRHPHAVVGLLAATRSPSPATWACSTTPR